MINLMGKTSPQNEGYRPYFSAQDNKRMSVIHKPNGLRPTDIHLASISSGYQDSNLGPPAPKAGALTGLRYIPRRQRGEVIQIFIEMKSATASLAVWTGLEPATPCVTGRYSNQLNYHTKCSCRLL